MSHTLDREEFLPVSDIKKRGWTDALIARFLGRPDDTRVNPHYRSGPPMRLYKLDRIERVEASTEYREVQRGRQCKRDSAQKALATKRQKIAEYIARVAIVVPQLSKEELIRRACNHYNERSLRDERRIGYNPASPHSDPAFLDRICVNYLRHCLTSYESHLREIAGKVGAPDAYCAIKTKVLAAIGDAYDWLYEECRQQGQSVA
jgi:hypothetical protein